MVNKVILMGHVGRDPEVRHVDNNMTVARFTLATHERWNNKDGNRVEHTEWHNIVMWRGLAEIAEKYVRKGSLIYVEGRMRSRSYDDREGVKRYVTEILADAMNLVGARPEGAQASAQQQVALQAAPLPPIEQETTTDLPF
jgi:single-strand DNA-binding protein